MPRSTASIERKRTPDMTPERFADIETRLDLPVKELAARLGVRPWCVWAWRTGWRTVPTETARTLRALLDGHGAS